VLLSGDSLAQSSGLQGSCWGAELPAHQSVSGPALRHKLVRNVQHTALSRSRNSHRRLEHTVTPHAHTDGV